ncbi:MAG: hypothetical protein AB1679_24070 [Actinomycetota bacterium]
MSRYEIPCRLPNLTCVVGWDPPAATFFAHIYDDGAENPDEPVIWIGETLYAEVVYPEELALRIAPWADLPLAIARRLDDDRHTDPPWPRGHIDIHAWRAAQAHALGWGHGASPLPGPGAGP